MRNILKNMILSGAMPRTRIGAALPASPIAAVKRANGVPGMKEGGNWIQGAIQKPGALKKTLGVKAGEKIPAKALDAAAKKPGITGKRARLAQTLKKLHK